MGRSQTLNPLLQDAFVLPKDAFQVTLGYSSLGLSRQGESTGLYNSMDLQVSLGIAPRTTLVTRYERVWPAKHFFEELAINFLFVGPKFQLKKDRLSLYVPVGLEFAKGLDGYFEVAPTLIGTIPLSRRVFLNPGLELGFMFCEYCEDAPFLGLNLGLSVRPNKILSFFADYDLVYPTADFGNGHLYMINGGVGFLFNAKDTE